MASAAFNVVTSARLLVGLTVSVVVGFVLCTAISQRIEHENARSTTQIVTKAMPAVRLMSTVRDELRELSIDLAARGENTPSQLVRIIADHRRNMDAALASYQELGFFTGEHALYSPLAALWPQLDAQLAAITPSSPAYEVADVDDTIAHIDNICERIETYDAFEGERLGMRISDARGDSRATVWTLYLTTASLALGAMALATRQRRRAVRELLDENAATEQNIADLRTKVDDLAHFAGRVAHDIRGPLHTALLSVEVAEAAPDRERQQRALNAGVQSLRRMGSLIDDLFEFARAGGKPVSGETTDTADLVRSLIESLAADAHDGRVELTTSQLTDVRVDCAPGVLTSIVSNLARNAIRHMGDSAERRVDIRVRAVAERCRIEVEDTGPGIPPGQEHRIFEPHVQLDRHGGGIGLGLATVDRLVRAHGGSLGVESPPGRGALFWVELPQKQAAHA
jgi:signal transduction histidine kinase